MFEYTPDPDNQYATAFCMAAWLGTGKYARELVYEIKHPMMADMISNYSETLCALRFNDTALREFVDQYDRNRLQNLGSRIEGIKQRHLKS